MQISAQTGPHFASLLGDDELAGVLSARADVQAMVAVEIALAQVQSGLGILPADAGDRMADVLSGFAPDPDVIAKGVAASGIPIPSLLSEMRAALPDDLAHFVHWGATTQDIMDTAMVMQAGACLDLLGARLRGLIDTLHGQSQTHAATVMAGRTRTQIAAPITFGLKIAQWAQPLITLETELDALRAKVLRVQFGGAVGANSAVAPHGPAIAAGLANALNLRNSPPWHTDRSGVMALSHWLADLTAALVKIARDLTILSRSEVAEVFAGTAGGSSTMPQKANPVQSEAVLTLGTLANALHSGLQSAASPAEERDGASWTVEWVLLPQLILSAGAALRHGGALANTLRVDAGRMRANMDGNSGLMAEAASFALAANMPRDAAQKTVKQAVTLGGDLADALAQVSDIQIDWADVLAPDHVVAPCQAVADQIFAARSESG